MSRERVCVAGTTLGRVGCGTKKRSRDRLTVAAKLHDYFTAARFRHESAWPAAVIGVTVTFSPLPSALQKRRSSER